VIVALAVARPAQAQVYTVTNTSDSGVLGDGSLRGPRSEEGEQGREGGGGGGEEASPW
jgi:hypothetical protein